MDWNSWWPLLVAIGIVLGVIPVAGLYLIFVERKLAAWIQNRSGPNRVGPLGLLQAVADGLKIFVKEQVIPSHVNKPVYLTAPMIGLICAMLAIAVVPYGPTKTEPTEGFRAIIAPGIDIGLLFLFAISSLSVYGIILGGWASNNKYSLYGAIRSCAQFISYEIPLGLSVIGVVAAAGTLNIESIVQSQGEGIGQWNIWWQPLAGLIFFTAALAETNRLPFDLAECEQELVGGFHTEYAGIKFVLFFLAEYTHIGTVSFLTVLLFFGGWHFPGLTGEIDATLGGYLLRWFVLVAKVAVVILLIMQLRWTLPRFRFDQLMNLAWKGLIPMGVGNLLGLVVILTLGLPHWWMAVISVAIVFLIGFSSVLIHDNSRSSKSSGTGSSAGDLAAVGEAH